MRGRTAIRFTTRRHLCQRPGCLPPAATGLDPGRQGEGHRTALSDLLKTLPLAPGDVLVLDRGFASRQRFGVLLDCGVDRVARMSTAVVDAWTEVAEFLAKGNGSARIRLNVGVRSDPGTGMRAWLSVTGRAVVPAKGGREERAHGDLDHTRRGGRPHSRRRDQALRCTLGIESLYRNSNRSWGSRIEPFHGTNVHGCEQEIAASLLWMAFAAYLQGEAERTLEGRKGYRSD